VEGLQSTNDFLLWFADVSAEIEQRGDADYHKYLQQLEQRKAECSHMLDQIAGAMERLGALCDEYDFVSQKTSALNTASEQLIDGLLKGTDGLVVGTELHRGGAHSAAQGGHYNVPLSFGRTSACDDLVG